MLDWSFFFRMPIVIPIYKGPAPFGVEPSPSLPPWMHGMHSGRCASPVFPLRLLK